MYLCRCVWIMLLWSTVKWFVTLLILVLINPKIFKHALEYGYDYLIL